MGCCQSAEDRLPAKEKQQWLDRVAKNGLELSYAPKELRGDRQVVRAAVAQDGAALEYASEEMPGGPSLSGGHGAPGRPHSGASARGEELRSDHELVLAAVAQNGLALQYASKELRKDRAFVLKAVEKTRAWFLVNWAGPELRVDKDFQRRCVDTCSTGLVFTYYESYTAFTNMRSSFLATGASVPGGQAYERVMEQLRNRGDEGAATVWFDKVPAFGAFADAGRWLHPSEECGRDYSPVPPDSPGRHPMWRSKVESCAAESIPEVGSKHPCWCCHWIRKVRERHASRRRDLLHRVQHLQSSLGERTRSRIV
ncbi:unnamed protein product [Effrenium voratum]|uniref:DUF4116 domain-containing protein n=1 Tax=Effrenium voratum TaxID=2562239 RepID=A0AA36JAN4_9DINO|nr:unnamed protein product [Effrenium voratum]